MSLGLNNTYVEGAFRRLTPNELYVPESNFDVKLNNDLHTPNQDVPLNVDCGEVGFIPGTNNRFYRCVDGSIIDTVNHKIINNIDNVSDKPRIIHDNSRYQDWNDADIYSFNNDNNLGSSGVSLSQQDIQYNKAMQKGNA